MTHSKLRGVEYRAIKHAPWTPPCNRLNQLLQVACEQRDSCIVHRSYFSRPNHLPLAYLMAEGSCRSLVLDNTGEPRNQIRDV